MREGAPKKVPKVGEGVRAVRVRTVCLVAHQRTYLRERYAVAKELPPRLLALVRKLDAAEGNRSQAR